ncbi:hypothetical protein [Rhodococcus gannanensis]|uniref:Uncharacterized protein n=1 Tax=Rhodococcus gannanensis TaxID=1960308 RepID=A0ABW4P118_9NOCA
MHTTLGMTAATTGAGAAAGIGSAVVTGAGGNATVVSSAGVVRTALVVLDGSLAVSAVSLLPQPATTTAVSAAVETIPATRSARERLGDSDARRFGTRAGRADGWRRMMILVVSGLKVATPEALTLRIRGTGARSRRR